MAVVKVRSAETMTPSMLARVHDLRATLACHRLPVRRIHGCGRLQGYVANVHLGLYVLIEKVLIVFVNTPTSIIRRLIFLASAPAPLVPSSLPTNGKRGCSDLRSRRRKLLRCGVAIVVSGPWAPLAPAQESTDGPFADRKLFSLKLSDAAPNAAPEPPAMASLRPTLPRYSGDLSTRSHFTGDWGGKRIELAEQGITLEVELIQLLQSNVSGGRHTDTKQRYSGSVDYYLRFDTARMGLWPAGQLLVHAETQFGRSVNPLVGSAMAPNADALFPHPDDPGTTAVSQVWYTQFLSEKFGFSLGKGDMRGGDNTAFAHDENTQFQNLAFVLNPVLLSVGTYSSLRAGVFYRPANWLGVTFSVIDPLGSPTTVGFDTAFHSPDATFFYNEWVFTIEPFGQPGHQRFGIAYSTDEVNLLDQSGRDGRLVNIIQGGPLRILSRLINLRRNGFQSRPDDWAFLYNFDQYLFQESEDPTQGIGLFGRFGISDGDANPIHSFYSIGVGGKGIIPERDNDRFGLGYFYTKWSDIPLTNALGISNSQGVELFYNIEVTPWLHITPDLQVLVNPGGVDDRDVAIVYGLRAQMSF